MIISITNVVFVENSFNCLFLLILLVQFVRCRVCWLNCILEYQIFAVSPFRLYLRALCCYEILISKSLRSGLYLQHLSFYRDSLTKPYVSIRSVSVRSGKIISQLWKYHYKSWNFLTIFQFLWPTCLDEFFLFFWYELNYMHFESFTRLCWLICLMWWFLKLSKLISNIFTFIPKFKIMTVWRIWYTIDIYSWNFKNWKNYFEETWRLFCYCVYFVFYLFL